MFFLAVASAVGGDRERAGHTLGRARKADPGRSGEWISVLAGIAQRHPAVLPLIVALNAPAAEPAAMLPEAPDDPQ